MTQNKKNKLQAIVAIAFSVFVVGVAITLLIFDKIEGEIFATLIISSPLPHDHSYRTHNSTCRL